MPKLLVGDVVKYTGDMIDDPWNNITADTLYVIMKKELMEDYYDYRKKTWHAVCQKVFSTGGYDSDAALPLRDLKLVQRA